MKNISKPNFKLIKGTRLTSALFIGASLALAAGIIFGANIYYNIDTSKIVVEDTYLATTTQITVNSGNTTALTVTQSGSAAAVSVTSTAAMTSDIFKISNLGSGKSLVVEDSDTDTSAFTVDAGGNVGVATSTPSATGLSVQGNILGSGNIVLYGTAATSTFSAPIQVTQIKITGPTAPADGFVLTATDVLGNAQWEAVPTGVWTSSGGFIFQTALSDNVAISTTTARYDLDVWGSASFGTTTVFSIPLLLVDSNTKRVGIASSTPSDAFAVQGNVVASGDVLFYGANSTTTIGGGLVVDTNTLYVAPVPNRVGIASTTPSDTLSVGGNIIGSGNLVIYGTGTSTFVGGLSIAGLETTGSIFSDNALNLTSLGGAITITPASNSNTSVVLGGTGQFTVGSSGQFFIDASGNATTTGNIYASAFISTGNNAYTRKAGDEIVRGVVPVFGFDLPARCKTSCSSGTATATISRVIENDDDIFPQQATGTTRKYRFTIRYSDATTTANIRSTWDVATSSDPSNVSRFTLPSPGTADLTKGFTTTTNFVTLPATDDWFLRVSTGGTGNYDFQVYEILLIGIDQVN